MPIPVTWRRRQTFVLALAVAAIPAAVAAIPFLRGATHAAFDQMRGRHILYQLGCEVGLSHPRNPKDFRLEEILRERYGLNWYTVGGFGPSRSLFQWVYGYNTVSGHLMVWRHGSDFIDREREVAKRDVIVRNVELRGCYTFGRLHMQSGELIDVGRAESVPEDSLYYTSSPQPVIVTGPLTEVRAGRWNAEHGRFIRAERLQLDSTTQCAPGRVSGSH